MRSWKERLRKRPHGHQLGSERLLLVLVNNRLVSSLIGLYCLLAFSIRVDRRPGHLQLFWRLLLTTVRKGEKRMRQRLSCRWPLVWVALKQSLNEWRQREVRE